MDDMSINTVDSYQKETEEIKKMNFLQRLIGIIVSPAETMKNLVHKPRILFPIILIALGLVLFYIIRFPLYVETIKPSIELALEKAGMQFTPEQLDQQVNISAIAGLVAIPFGALIGWIVWSSIIFGVIKIFKGKGSYKQVLSVTGYSYAVTILYLILLAIISFATNTLAVDVPITSAATLLSDDSKGTFLYGVLTGVEVFAIWKLVVAGIGLKLVSKLSGKKIFTILIVLYVLGFLITGLSQSVASMVS
jgi:hypothetical protein